MLKKVCKKLYSNQKRGWINWVVVYLFVLSIFIFRRELIHDQALVRIFHVANNFEKGCYELSCVTRNIFYGHFLYDYFLFGALVFARKVVGVGFYYTHAFYCSLYVFLYIWGVSNYIKTYRVTSLQGNLICIACIISSPLLVNQIFLMEDNIAAYAFIGIIFYFLKSYLSDRSDRSLCGLLASISISTYFYLLSIVFAVVIPFIFYQAYKVKNKKHQFCILLFALSFPVVHFLCIRVLGSSPLEQLINKVVSGEAGYGYYNSSGLSIFSKQHWHDYMGGVFDGFYFYFNDKVQAVAPWVTKGSMLANIFIFIFFAINIFLISIVKKTLYSKLKILVFVLIFFISVYWEPGVYQKSDLVFIFFILFIPNFLESSIFSRYLMFALYVPLTIFALTELATTPFNYSNSKAYYSYKDNYTKIAGAYSKNGCVLLNSVYANFNIWTIIEIPELADNVYYYFNNDQRSYTKSSYNQISNKMHYLVFPVLWTHEVRHILKPDIEKCYMNI